MIADDLAQTHSAAFGEKAWDAATFQKFLSDPSVLLTGNTDSFVLGRITVDEAELLTVATAPPLRRSGLASKALADFMQAAAQAGAKTAFLEVAQTNLAAISLYTDLGFNEVGRRKNYYKNANAKTVDALILSIDLSSAALRKI